MSNLKNVLFWSTALVGANYLSNGAIANTVTNAASNVAGIVGSGVSSAAPIVWWPIPGVLAAWASVWNGSKEYQERGIWGVTEKSALNYGLWAGLLTATWVIAAPAVAWVATVWLWMYGARKLAGVGMDIANDPWQTYRWAPNAMRWLRWKPANSNTQQALAA